MKEETLRDGVYRQVEYAIEILCENLDDQAAKFESDSVEMLSTLQSVLEEFDINEYYAEWIAEGWENA